MTSCQLEYGPSLYYGHTAACTPAPGAGETPVTVSAAVASLAHSTEYHFRVVASSSTGMSYGSDASFSTPAVAPTVVTEAASAVTSTSATLHARVNPEGTEVSPAHCVFEYGTSPAYGKAVPCTGSLGARKRRFRCRPRSLVSTRHRLPLPDLRHQRCGYRRGSDAKFTTHAVPIVATLAATGISDAAMTLTATVNPEAQPVSSEDCFFEYGRTPAYGQTAPCEEAVGAGEAAVAVSATITGLQANTEYHYRISATNATGTSTGADETATTLNVPLPVVVTGSGAPAGHFSAGLTATVNPEGHEVGAAACSFEYGPTEAYGSKAACQSAPGSGNTAVPVSAWSNAWSRGGSITSGSRPATPAGPRPGRTAPSRHRRSTPAKTSA